MADTLVTLADNAIEALEDLEWYLREQRYRSEYERVDGIQADIKNIVREVQAQEGNE